MSTTDSPRERRKKTPSTERRGIPKQCDGDSAKNFFDFFSVARPRFAHALQIASSSVAACRMDAHDERERVSRIDDCTRAKSLRTQGVKQTFARKYADVMSIGGNARRAATALQLCNRRLWSRAQGSLRALTRCNVACVRQRHGSRIRAMDEMFHAHRPTAAILCRLAVRWKSTSLTALHQSVAAVM
jgi:hypothetical protein